MANPPPPRNKDFRGKLLEHVEISSDVELRSTIVSSERRSSYRVSNVLVPVYKIDVEYEWVRISLWKSILYYLAVIFTGGLLFVFCINKPLLKLFWTTSKCEADTAEMAYVVLPGGDYAFSVVEKANVESVTILAFELNCSRYFATTLDPGLMKVMDEPEDFSEIFVVGNKGKQPSRDYQCAVYGLNKLNLPPADPVAVVVVECLSPFYLFQYFAVAVWVYTDYIVYSTIVMFITCLSIYFVCADKLFNLRRLHDLADSLDTIDRTDRNGTVIGMETNVRDIYLVPGDCFFVANDMTLPCDCILLSGKVVVDEAMLTGESMPITKTPFVKSSIDTDATKRKANILFCGTKVKSIGSGDRPVAMVYRTGFRSAKGSIVGTLAQPQQEIVSFMPDALRAILFMVILTTGIFGWSADELSSFGTSNEDIILAYLTALTIAVPPGLVACLSIATSISVVRLGKQHISISDTSKLNAAGYISVACFDKTGTLTDENINFQGTYLYKNGAHIEGDERTEKIGIQIMATCHALSILDGVPVGDQLELELLKVSGWKLLPPSQTNHMVAVSVEKEEHVILKHFEFSPDKLRAGTLLECPDKSKIFLLKGSPETIISLCLPDTVPASVHEDIAVFTKKGFRVLGLAYRHCPQSSAALMEKSQSELEESAVFLGLVFFSNKLKADTWPATISGLQNANIQVNMITGDHASTAIAISTECHILPEKRQLYLIDISLDGYVVIINVNTGAIEPSLVVSQLTDMWEASNAQGTAIEEPVRLAITGQAMTALEESLEPSAFLRLLRSCCVFARAKPFQKKQIVTELKRPATAEGEQTYVLFCGDGIMCEILIFRIERMNDLFLFISTGANDMEALACATVGVSLCDTATTVAASIVSITQSPLSTVHVLREGRCSLITAYVLVMYNIMYAVIQLFMTCYLNNLGLIFGDNMYLIQDLFFSLILGLCISNTLPHDDLSTRLPPKRLFSLGIMVKLVVQLALFPAFQAITLAALESQAWYDKFDPGDEPLTESWAVEAGTLQIVALSQLMIASVVVTIGEPFRKPWYTNKAHLGVMLLQTCFIIYLMFGVRNEFMRSITNYPSPDVFGGILVGIIAANAVASAIGTKIADYFFTLDN